MSEFNLDNFKSDVSHWVPKIEDYSDGLWDDMDKEIHFPPPHVSVWTKVMLGILFGAFLFTVFVVMSLAIRLVF